MLKYRFLATALTTLIWSVSVSGGDCIQECQRRLKDKVKICDDLFESEGSAHYHDTKWHDTCLKNAKTEFDNCKSTCQ
jgi:hypothetical protein